MNGISTVGVPWGTRCSNMWLVFLIYPNNINLIHKGRARVSVSFGFENFLHLVRMVQKWRLLGQHSWADVCRGLLYFVNFRFSEGEWFWHCCKKSNKIFGISIILAFYLWTHTFRYYTQYSCIFIGLLQLHNIKNLCMELCTIWATLKRNSYCNRGLISVSTERIRLLNYEQNDSRRRKHEQRQAMYI
jgi:hypothetical protein